MTGTPFQPPQPRPGNTGWISQHGGINVANSGQVGGDFIVTPVQPNVVARPEPVASYYLDQVVRRQIAPKVLHGRDAELAELARFCTDGDPGAASYAWWRGPAWSGKSALLSWFVLHPPPGVCVVAFFLRAHVPHQRDWIAFSDSLLRQLAALLAKPMPTGLTDATREEGLLALLEEAAETCWRRGERLVLAVDALDEDLGGYSVARLLPAELPAGMRTIVTSRDHPPLRQDVLEEGHPLGNEAVVRVLGASEHARMVRTHAEAEITRLASGSDLERLLLGLVTAARGGLSEADLAYLADCTEFEVERQLRGVTGRTFTTQSSYYRPDDGPRVYVLAHRDLQAMAEHSLRGAPLQDACRRLHAWSDSFRGKGCPVDTPEYLLRGYFDMLQEAGDIERMVACATDPARQYRMLDVTGGDTAALAQITAAQRAVLAQDDPDLLAMTRLSIHRNALTRRNELLSERLPLVWARLGNRIRAESLARSITEPGRRGFALSQLAMWAAGIGDIDRAEVLANDVTFPEWQTEALTVIARAAADRGDTARALELVRRAEPMAACVSDPSRQAQASTELAFALAKAGDVGRAERIIGAIGDRGARHQAAAALAEAVAASGDIGSARIIAGALDDQAARAGAFARIATVLARSGDLEGVRCVADAIDDPAWQAQTLLWAAGTAAAGGDLEGGESISGLITEPESRSAALIGVASHLIVKGEHARARELARRAESVIATLSDPMRQWQGSTQMSILFAQAGDIDRAEAIARSRTDPAQYMWGARKVARAIAALDVDRAEALADAVAQPFGRAAVLLEVAAGASDKGAHSRAIAVLRRAEAAAGIDDIADPEARATFTSALVRGAAANGDIAYCDALVATMDDRKRAAKVLNESVLQAARAGNAEIVTGITRSAMFIRHTSLHNRSWVLADAAEAAAGAGELDAAEAIARSIVDPEVLAGRLNTMAESSQVKAMATVADAAAQAGEYERATKLAVDAENLAYASVAPQVKQWALEAIATAVAMAGDIDAAVALALELNAPEAQQEKLAVISEIAADAGNTDTAENIAATISDPWNQARAVAGASRAAFRAGDQARAAALAQQAESIALSITEPYQRIGILAGMAVCAGVEGDDTHARTWADHADAQAQSLPDTPGKSAMLVDAVKAVAAAGDVERAQTIAVQIDDPYYEAEALSWVAHLAARAGDLHLAEAVANTVTQPAVRAEALAKAAIEAARKAGDHPSAFRLAERAEAVASAISEERARERALEKSRTAAVIAAVLAGEIERAETVAAAYQEPRAGTRLFTALASVAPPLPARRAMARALAHGGAWATLLTTLAKIDPATVRAIVDEFITVLGPAGARRG
ncbi:hypothetical protein KDK95_10095 [Actinospica sp. MGRD01-02]|uniref:Uncharacterized protein n=1 Tax=Actinospica acidithermotolerans TaxID=2828514 RepID=A0A941EA03_9ACTN|nr:hypothetical protein [Actinospica acidithermotolerans]MBR7826653.1 hypothetical protein [Actinospica acidithermotolerans]